MLTKNGRDKPRLTDGKLPRTTEHKYTNLAASQLYTKVKSAAHWIGFMLQVDTS